MQLQLFDMVLEVVCFFFVLFVFWVVLVGSWYFYVDYKVFSMVVCCFESFVDDVLLEFFYVVYLVDSIGYLYLAWKLEVDNRSVFSLFGKGVYIFFLNWLD